MSSAVPPPPPPPPSQPPSEPSPADPQPAAARRWRWVVAGATAGAVLGASAAVPLTWALLDDEPMQVAEQEQPQRPGPDRTPWFGGRSPLVPSEQNGERASDDEGRGVVLIDTALPTGAGAGTGLVLSEDGLVLTNYHVVDGSFEVRATVAGTGTTYSGRVLGYHASADVALVQLDDAKGLDTVRLDDDGDDDEVGDPVTAVGNGRGVGMLVTVDGAITAVDRDITTSPPHSESLTGLIETDAPAVPGYSGGPMLDEEGEVIGVTTAASDGGPGQSYAVPIEDALDIVDRIEAGDEGDGVHVGAPPYLGVTITEDDQDGDGVRVAGVADDTPADEAGLVEGDLITAVDGERVTTVRELLDALDAYQPGDGIELSWTHDGEERSAPVTLEESPYA